MIRRATTSCLIGFALAGCAAPRTAAIDGSSSSHIATPANVTPDSGTPPLGGTKEGKWINITPLTTVSWSTPDSPDGRFSDAYTRLIITSLTPDNCGTDVACANADSYPYKSREWLERFFVGAHHTINLTAKITIGTFSATVPLATIDHVSNRTDGEGFTRTVYHQAEQFPLFLVKGDGSNGVASAQFLVKGSDQYQSSVAATALEVAQQITTFVAPQAKVLTTLTAQSNKDLAAAMDKTVSQLLGTKIDEGHWIDKDTTLWGDGATATFKIPASEGNWENDKNYLTVGSWTVSFEVARPSIFSDAQICNPPEKTDTVAPTRCFPSFDAAAKFAEKSTLIKPQDILGYHLVESAPGVGTVGAYLKQLDWWQTALKAFPADAAPKDADITKYCRSIKGAISDLQLNYVDQGIVVVAVQKAASLPPKTVDAMSKNKECGFAI